eukprot:1219003-Pleurochrysis_carterae.AAC.1
MRSAKAERAHYIHALLNPARPKSSMPLKCVNHACERSRAPSRSVRGRRAAAPRAASACSTHGRS